MKEGKTSKFTDIDAHYSEDKKEIIVIVHHHTITTMSVEPSAATTNIIEIADSNFFKSQSTRKDHVFVDSLTIKESL